MMRPERDDDFIAVVNFLSVAFVATVILGYVFLGLIGLMVGRG